ncbi:MAG: AraC family transcriptional regulator [Flavobacteriaceae bacterium]|nr:MAG: AraC family transcriptional regulator [Flavobacteriaceae bacterium]
MPSLQTIQIIALIQGFFLLFVLFKHKKNYKSTQFWLLFFCIVSVLLFVLGDDDYNLFVENADWYCFHDTLIITVFFIFVRFYTSNRNKFTGLDGLFFVPYLLEISLKFIETTFGIKNLVTYLIDYAVELVFFAMLIYTIIDIIRSKKEKWLLLFIIPLTIIFSIDELTWFFTKEYDSPYYLDSYGIILLSVFLFYFVLYRLIIAPKQLLEKGAISNYKKTTLVAQDIASHKKALLQLMEEDKIFTNKNLTVLEVSNTLNISRQQLSEILNVHLNCNFQDFINGYRVEEFKRCVASDVYTNYTIIAIAKVAGFSSKTTFNTLFKKATGMTPSGYKKQL